MSRLILHECDVCGVAAPEIRKGWRTTYLNLYCEKHANIGIRKVVTKSGRKVIHNSQTSFDGRSGFLSKRGARNLD